MPTTRQIVTTGAGPSQPRSQRVGRDVRKWGLLALAAFILSWPAIWNRFPLVFFDSSSYVVRSAAAATMLVKHTDQKTLIAARRSETPDESYTRKISSNPAFLRPLFYSVWLAPFSTALTFALLPFGQGLLAAYVIRRALDLSGAASNAAFILAIGLVAGASSLPWHVSYVMPDLFTGFVVAMAYVLVASWPHNGWIARLRDVGLLSFLIASHLSHVPLGLGLVAVVGSATMLAAWKWPGRYRLGGGLIGLGTAVALAAAALVGSNLVLAGRATLSESSPLFLLARLIGDGPGRAYLTAACPTKPYRICAELAHLTDRNAEGSISDRILWDHDGIMKRIAWPGLLDEAAEINRETIRTYPAEVLGHALVNGVRQFGVVQIDETLNVPPNEMLIRAFSQIDPTVSQAMMRSQQANGGFPLETVRRLYAAGLAACVLWIAILLAMRWRRIGPSAWCFAAVVMLGLIGNAMVTGGLSEVHDRYQNRLIWLIFLLPVVFTFATRAKRAAVASPASDAMHEGVVDLTPARS